MLQSPRDALIQFLANTVESVWTIGATPHSESLPAFDDIRLFTVFIMPWLDAAN